MIAVEKEYLLLCDILLHSFFAEADSRNNVSYLSLSHLLLTYTVTFAIAIVIETINIDILTLQLHVIFDTVILITCVYFRTVFLR